MFIFQKYTFNSGKTSFLKLDTETGDAFVLIREIAGADTSPHRWEKVQ